MFLRFCFGDNPRFLVYRQEVVFPAWEVGLSDPDRLIMALYAWQISINLSLSTLPEESG